MTKELQLALSDISQLPQVAKRILEFAGSRKLFLFYAPMGAGKTTLIKELCRQLGSKDNFGSPTYSIINEYAIEATKEKIYHIDLYRVKDLAEAMDAGIEECLESGDYCFIEWPELIEIMLPYPSETLKINIEVVNDIRNLSIFIN